MRLLIDSHCFDFKSSQGISVYIKGLYSHLTMLNSNIEYFFIGQNTEKLQKIFGTQDNVHYIRLKSKNNFIRLFFEIPKIIKENKIDVAHFQYVAPLIKNCKTIVTLHDVLFLDYPEYFPSTYKLSKKWPFKISAKRADLLCTVSKYSQERISYHYGINPEKIYITPNAVDNDFYSIQAARPEEFPQRYLLYVSRIEPRKNHIDLIRSFLRLNLSEKGYKLVLIGKETIPTPELHNLISQLTPKEREAILIIPQVSFAELKLWYKFSDLFVYPTIAEGFGIPPIEAAAANIPVISNNSTAMSDFTFFGKNLIDIKNENLLDETILANLNLRELKDLDIIKRYVKSTFNWETIAEDFNLQLAKTFENKF